MKSLKKTKKLFTLLTGIVAVVLVIFVISCNSDNLNENKEMNSDANNSIEFLGIDVPTHTSKNYLKSLTSKNGNKINSNKLYSLVPQKTINLVLDKLNFDLSLIENKETIKVDIYYKGESVASNNIKAISVYFLDNNFLFHKYFELINGNYVNDDIFNAQVKKVYSSNTELIYSYSFYDYNNNSGLVSFFNNNKEYSISINQTTLKTLLYKNLSFEKLIDDTFTDGETCGGSCKYGQDFEDCSGGVCERNCICCFDALSSNLNDESKVMDANNAYRLRDGFLRTNDFTKRYINLYYLTSDIYCNEKLYRWSEIGTYYEIYSILDDIATRLNSDDYKGVVISTREANLLNSFIDSERIRNNKYSLLNDIYLLVKSDIDFYKNKSKIDVVSHIENFRN